MGRRRRRAVIGTVVLAVVPVVVILVATLAGDRERMEQYFEVATVDADGRARVDEVIDYDFGSGAERHGIYRIVPGLLEGSVEVSSPSAPDETLITGGKIRIGDPDATVTGSHRYVIGYSLDSLVRGDELAWDVVGNEWGVTIESVEAHVISARELRSPRCDQGSFGAIGGCTATEVEPGHLVVRTGPVSSGDAVTVRATLGDPVASIPSAPVPPPPPSDSGAPLFLPAVLGFVLAAGGGLLTGRVLRWAGREHAPLGYLGAAPGALMRAPGMVDATDLDADAPPQVAPPRRLTAAEGGVVLAERVRGEHKAAWLLGQAQHGAVALDGDAISPTLRWIGGHGAADNAALLTMFDGRPTVQLGTYDKSFAAGWTMVGAELGAWRSASGLWDPAGDRRRRRALLLGVLLLLVGPVVAAILAFRWSVASPSAWQLALLALPFGVGVGLVLHAWELRVRTAEGSALYVEVAAFRRYLAAAAADDVERVAGGGLLHDYLAWAVALGVSSEWIGAVEASAAARGHVYASYDPGLFLIAGSLDTTTTAASTVPSSSGSSGGGGGGGGAGGGGGGGGGGSW